MCRGASGGVRGALGGQPRGSRNRASGLDLQLYGNREAGPQRTRCETRHAGLRNAELLGEVTLPYVGLFQEFCEAVHATRNT